MNRALVELCRGPLDGMSVDVALIGGFLPHRVNIPILNRAAFNDPAPITDFATYVPDVKRPTVRSTTATASATKFRFVYLPPGKLP